MFFVLSEKKYITVTAEQSGQFKYLPVLAEKADKPEVKDSFCHKKSRRLVRLVKGLLYELIPVF